MRCKLICEKVSTKGNILFSYITHSFHTVWIMIPSSKKFLNGCMNSFLCLAPVPINKNNILLLHMMLPYRNRICSLRRVQLWTVHKAGLDMDHEPDLAPVSSLSGQVLVRFCVQQATCKQATILAAVSSSVPHTGVILHASAQHIHHRTMTFKAFCGERWNKMLAAISLVDYLKWFHRVPVSTMLVAFLNKLKALKSTRNFEFLCGLFHKRCLC